MNQQYIYNNGKAIVIDHNGNQTTVDYYDKLKEVLEQENLIEILDRKKWHLVGKQKDYEREYQKLIKDQHRGLKGMIFLAIGAVTIGLLLPNFLNLPMIKSIEFIIPTLTIIGVGSVCGLISFFKDKKYVLEKKEINEENLEKLESQLELQKQHLEELKKDKTNTREKEGFGVSKLNGGFTLMTNNEELKEFSNLYNFSDMTIYQYHWNHASDCDSSENTEEKSHVLKKTLR